MAGLWLASYLVLWVLVVVICLCLVGVLRQLGATQLQLEQQRTQPQPGIPPLEEDGPPIGAPVPDLIAESINGFGVVRPETLGEQHDTLLMFMSPMCETCQQVVEPLNALVEEGMRTIRVVVIMRADEQACRAFVSVFPLRMPVMCDSDRTITMGFDVHRTPFGLLYSGDGRLVRKGLVEGHGDLQALLGDPSAQLIDEQSRVFPPPVSPDVDRVHADTRS